jgi:ribosome-binding ATPase YchF (GTP1/OBG family)
MGFKVGIVGLPNVGKSTLFNALTRTAAAQAANFPFCTIEPNVGDVAVPDPRLDKLAEIAKSKQVIPARMTFVDIAGLVKGASKGEGLGNQFLANIREVDAIAHVLRCFEDGDVTHVEGRVDPGRGCRDHRDRADARRSGVDREAAAEHRPQGARRRQGGGAAGTPDAGGAGRMLEDGKPARMVEVADEDQKAWKMLQLLTAKPVLFVCNVAEDEAGDRATPFSARVAEMAEAQGAAHVVISAKIEEEIASWSRTRRDVPDRAGPGRGGPRPDDPRGLRAPAA